MTDWTKRAMLLLSLLSLPMMACEDDEEDVSDYDYYDYWASSTADFSGYQTYRFEDIPAETIDQIPQYVVNNHDAIKALVATELEAQGLTEDTDNPDLVVSSLAATEDATAWYADCNAGWYWYGWWGGYDSCAWIDVEEINYEVATIVIPVADAATEDLVFAGYLQGIVDDSEDAQARIEEGVHWIFSNGWPQQ